MDEQARIALEIKVAWLESLTIELDRQVRGLHDEVTRLRGQVEFLESQTLPGADGHERPPHYG
jgi:hypothetical protein